MNQRNLLLITVIAIIAVAAGTYAVFYQKPSSSDNTPTPSPTPTPTPKPTPSPSPSPTPSPVPEPPASKAGLLHAALWLNVTEKAETERLYAYAIYASRTLAVAHPEVYLRGDLLFLTSINSAEGYQRAYEIINVTDDYFISSDVEGPPFSLALVEFGAYETVPALDLYPQGYPTLSFLDRRMLSLGCTLKTTEGKLTQLEVAEQFYFNLKRLKSSETKFIIYCDNENTYTVSGGVLTSMADLKTANSVTGNPILIFNEESVWYPLMGRDDRSVNQALQQIVGEYSTGVTQPSISEEEKQILAILRNVTRIYSEEQYALALLASAHTEQTSASLDYDKYVPYWNIAEIPTESGEGLFRVMYKTANYLSPITAYLATVSNSSEGATLLTAICKEYTNHTATYFYKSGNVSWGHAWPCGLHGNTVDETYRTRGSHCVWQASNLAAVLDVLGIGNYVSELGVSDNGVITNAQWHNTIYVPEFDLVLGNGVVETLLYKRPNTVVSYSSDKPRLTVRFLSSGVEFADPFLSFDSNLSYYYGTISPSNLGQILERLADIHGDKLEGLIVGPSKGYAIPFDDMISNLSSLEAGFNPAKLP